MSNVWGAVVDLLVCSQSWAQYCDTEEMDRIYWVTFALRAESLLRFTYHSFSNRGVCEFWV